MSSSAHRRQEEPEREFSEGFPLIQRLQQLKIKNEPQANAAEPGVVMVKQKQNKIIRNTQL